MEHKSHLKKLHEKGLWIGPNAFLSQKLKRAYQLLNGKSFVGTFENGAFDSYPDFDSGNNTLYLGKPSELFQPVIGRDSIRDTNNKLKLLETEEEKAAVCEVSKRAKKKSGGIPVAVEPSDSVLYAYPLNHDRQKSLIEPSTFEGYEVQLCGVADAGREIALQLRKMGVGKLSVYDPSEVDELDLAVSGYRCFDPRRARAQALTEGLGDGTLSGVDYYLQHMPDELGQIVVNTFSDRDIRRSIWQAVLRSNVGLYIDAQGSGWTWRVWAINPKSKKSVEMYEASLDEVMDPYEQHISMVHLAASVVALAVARYIATPGNEQNSCLDRMYTLDANVFFRSGGLFGQMSL